MLISNVESGSSYNFDEEEAEGQGKVPQGHCLRLSAIQITLQRHRSQGPFRVPVSAREAAVAEVRSKGFLVLRPGECKRTTTTVYMDPMEPYVSTLAPAPRGARSSSDDQPSLEKGGNGLGRLPWH